ncbi:MAG: hypothetical protein LBO00_03870 [Zoogloeaceae bacterium]|jgi:hypothetical protein|nr:hypothetical protein [Zoogloeaceae bacterium]
MSNQQFHPGIPGWIEKEELAAIRAGDVNAFVRAVTQHADKCFTAGGSFSRFAPGISSISIARMDNNAERIALAIGHDLLRIIAQFPSGRNVLQCLGLETFLEDIKSE